MANMDIEPNGGNYGRNPGMRLYLVRDKHPNERWVVYNVTAREQFKTAYFIDPAQSYSLDWQYYIDNYYADFVERLQKAKVITRRYRLNDIDVHTFDQTKLVHDSGETFIVTKISNYVSGKGTDVELFKIN